MFPTDNHIMPNLKVATVQFEPVPSDKHQNFHKIQTFVENAAASNVDLLVFPEMCITGYWHCTKMSKESLLAIAEPIPAGPSTQALLSLAAKHNMTIGKLILKLQVSFVFVY